MEHEHDEHDVQARGESAPVTDHTSPEAGEVAGAPAAVRAAAARRDADSTTPATARARGVEWVRPTDLLARHTATLSGRGIDFQTELARRARTPITTGLHQAGHAARNRVGVRVGERALRLPPISAFGHSGVTSSGAVRSGVGMG